MTRYLVIQPWLRGRMPELFHPEGATTPYRSEPCAHQHVGRVPAVGDHVAGSAALD